MEPERALGEAAMLAGLRDIHLPAHGAGGLIAELCAALAVGLALALAAGLIARLFTRSQRAAREPALADRIAALRPLPEGERQVALLHLLRRHAPERFARLGPGLYRPGGLPGAEALEAELVRHD